MSVRHRKTGDTAPSSDQSKDKPDTAPEPTSAKPSSVSKGKTPSGQVFDLPQTHDVLSGLFDPRIRKSSFDKLILLSFALQLGLWATLPLGVSRWLFLGYFAFWRMSYDVGLGCILTKQSETRWIVRLVEKQGWMDASRHPKLQAWVRTQLESRMGKDYNYDVSSEKAKSLHLEESVLTCFSSFLLRCTGCALRVQCLAGFQAFG